MNTLRLISTLGLLLIFQTVFSQLPVQKPPTQKKLDQMMREMQKEYDSMDPEDKKMMKDAGFTLPDWNALPKFTDEEMREASEDADRIVPKKDMARIAKSNFKITSPLALDAYLKNLLTKVEAVNSPEFVSKAKSIYTSVNNKYPNTNAVEVTGIGGMAMGKADLTLYLLLRAGIDHSDDLNTLNNLAAMLNMMGYEEYALPVLNWVDALSPRNYIVKNNIGQAWFGMGDMENAQKQIDTSLALYPGNPQANHTKSFIEESKGNKNAAIEAMKLSIKSAYSSDKKYRLSKLGYQLKDKDVEWTIPMPADALGLEKFTMPPFPMNIDECVALKPVWDKYRAQCRMKLSELQAKTDQAEEAMMEAREERMQKSFIEKHGVVPWYADKAAQKLHFLLSEDFDGGSYNLKKTWEAYLATEKEIDRIDKVRSDEMEELNNTLGKKVREGMSGGEMEEYCQRATKIINTNIAEVNTLLKVKQSEYLSYLRRNLNDGTYYKQYAMWPEEYEVQKLIAQTQWIIEAMGPDNMRFVMNGGAFCMPKAPPPPGKTSGELQDFYDLNCETVSTFKVPFIGEMTNRCNLLLVKWDASIPIGAVLGAGTKGNLTIDSDRQTYTGTVEVGVTIGKGVKIVGPVKVGAGAGAAVAVELGSGGVKDVKLVGKSEVKIGAQFHPYKDAPKDSHSINTNVMNAEGKISIMSGPQKGVKGAKLTQ